MRPINRVMLIYPPVTFSPQCVKQSQVPLGIAYIAAVIRDQVEVNVLDAAVEGYEHEEKAGDKLLRYGLSFAEIERRIKEFKPDLVGISCIFSSQFGNVAQVAKAAKRVDPDAITITGGSHPTFLPELCMERCPELDLIALGEGELTLLDLIRASRNDGEPGDVLGLVWRKNGEVVLNRPRPPIENLDELPFPARDLFPLERYNKIGMPQSIIYKRRPFMNMISTRGCPFHCTFCSSTIFWNCYRERSAQNVLSEMEHLYRDLGIREFRFSDDNLTFDKKRAKAIFRGMIERGLDVSWHASNGLHAGSLDDEMLELMKKSGCYEIVLGVESGDPDVLRDIINKPVKLEQVEDLVRRIKKKGLGSSALFMIGFPGETREQIQHTLDFSRKLDLDRISCFIFTPLPGTPLFEECVAKGYIKAGETAEDIDYFEAHFDTPEWTMEEIYEIRRRWFWRYNFGLLIRHPVRFFLRYLGFLSKPRQALDIFKRRLRS